MKQLNLQDFDAVAFDVEGTLADTIPVHHTARLAAFKEHGYGHITREQHELGPTYGSMPADIIGGILHAAGEIDKSVPFAEHPQVQAIIETRKVLFAAGAADGFEAMPGAIDFVEALAPLYVGRLALVTSSEERFVLPFVERYGLGKYFADDLIIGHGAVVVEGLEDKPSPDPYILAAKRLHVDISRLLVFEDTVPGVMAAKKAGATVLGLGFDAHNARLFAADDLPYPPDVFVHDYTEARQALGL